MITLILGIVALFIIGMFALLRRKSIKLDRKIFVGALIGYGAVLVLSLVIFYAYVNPTLTNQAEYIEKKDTIKAERAAKSLYSLAYDGSLDQADDGLFLETKWNFDYDGNELNVHTPINNSVWMIMAERKETNDGKIEVVNYKTRTIVGHIDFTEKTKVPTVELQGDVLQIHFPKVVELNLGQFTNEFTSKQFTGENIIDVPRVLGRDILYLRIPKGIKLTGNINHIN